MSEQYCDICKKNIARIHISGEGRYCLECHNSRVLERFGKEDTYNYSENMSVLEPSGVIHSFKIEHMILGSIVSWDAYEQNGDYHFREISDIDENGAVVAKRFFQKIVDGVCTKTLQESDIPASNLLHRNGRILGLKDKGTINIIEDENMDHEIAFEIDGQVFSSEDFGRLLGAYSGFSLQYQIKDASAPVLKEDEYLVPVKITKKSLIEELEQAISIHGDRGFISYKILLPFDMTVYRILDKLEVLVKCGDKKEALEAGKEMVRIFLEIETDDDYFPEYFLVNIGRIVDPYGTDEELKQLIEPFYER